MGTPGRTMLAKIWDQHVIARLSADTDLLHIDRHLLYDLGGSRGLLGGTELVWDAVRGVPLRCALCDSRDPSTPVLELKVTGISYQPVVAGLFTATPPKGAKVVRLATPPATSHHTPKPCSASR